MQLNNKYALYARVSTINQTTDNQAIRLKEYAKQKGIDFTFFEETESTRRTRPVKQELLTLLRAKKFKGVIVYKIDRWARSSTELILEVKELIDKEIEFISISDNLSFSTSAGRLQFQILAAFAEFERSLISERTKEGLRRTKQQGTKLGRPIGSKDQKERPKSGYIMREAFKRKANDEAKGKYLPLKSYV